jgi:conjugal transfer pilus assembly protein TrbC
VSATDRDFVAGSGPAARIRVIAAALLLPTIVWAQPVAPVVTDDDIARAAKSQPAITDKDIEQAAKKHRMPTEAELARVPIQATPRVDALPQPVTRRPVDLGAVARGYEAMSQPGAAAALNAGPALLVFVSFSMPEAALSRLTDQAARSGATLVTRGFVNGSLQQTVARTQRLIGQRKVGFQIDPQAFDRFAVSAVPTFVLLRAAAMPEPCAAGTCFPTASYVSVAGDVSLDYALEFFKRSAPSFNQEAGAFLSKMRGGRE